eukprot:3405471-Amphidinium_carterae.1
MPHALKFKLYTIAVGNSGVSLNFKLHQTLVSKASGSITQLFTCFSLYLSTLTLLEVFECHVEGLYTKCLDMTSWSGQIRAAYSYAPAVSPSPRLVSNLPV